MTQIVLATMLPHSLRMSDCCGVNLSTSCSIMEKWNKTKSTELYGVEEWGAGYFAVTERGTICVRPDRGSSKKAIDLQELVESLMRRGIELPILIRFDGILRDRVRNLYSAFSEAIKEFGYSGKYRLAYPIKVNQQRSVVEAVVEQSNGLEIGLEVGSKPELLAVLAIKHATQALLLCNGYKDRHYIELALLSRKLGRRTIIIVEQLHEIRMVLEASKRLGIEPEIGIRFKPTARGTGRWESSAGEGAKFGLNYFEIMEAVDTLRAENCLHWVRLLHFHLGSQIPSIAAIQRALKEAGRSYVELRKLCPELTIVDVGGGLGVDYDGSRTNFESSMNYTLEEYARDVVWQLQAQSEDAGVPHPDILSESGRAVAAHHSVLIVEAMDTAEVLGVVPTLEEPPSEHETIEELRHLYDECTVKNCHETLHDALLLREEIIARYNQGTLDIRERAYCDKALKHLYCKIVHTSKELKFVPEDIEKLGDSLRDTYFCNFSVFQSIPDAWAIQHVFPIAPIHRLDEEPTRRAVLADLTCDSDGKIDRFIDRKSVKRHVLLHPRNNLSPYLLGFFLVGAYQEILGDLHNLFGDTNAVHVDCDEDGELQLRYLVEGDTVREVLSYVQFDPRLLLDNLRESIEGAVRRGDMVPEDSVTLQRRFRDVLEGYTYLVAAD